MHAAQSPSKYWPVDKRYLPSEAWEVEGRTKGMRGLVPSLVGKNERFCHDGQCSATLHLAAWLQAASFLFEVDSFFGVLL
jgi:hypothetical protein